MASISYYRRGKLVWTAHYGGMRAAKASIASTYERHHRVDGIDRADLRDDEGRLRLRLPTQARGTPG